MTAEESIADREIFRQRIDRLMADGRNDLLDQGAAPDDTLVKELNLPGSDLRCGVNLIFRPASSVIDHIQTIQDYLRQSEPLQYYYPASDLHLTLLEIAHDRRPPEAFDIAKSIQPELGGLLSNLPIPHLDSPVLGFDARAAALNFLPADGRLQSCRRVIGDRLEKLGVPVDSRYLPGSAHLTLMRYIRPLKSDPTQWVEKLLSAPPLPELTWVPSSVWLTWGHNWYGMKSRIDEAGPWPLAEA